MEDEKQVEQDRQRAEVFDALGHPTRIQILKVLSEGSLGFADLKKKTAIESSGHLQHHLTKLNGLIKTDEFGRYCLSDEGKDALITVQTVENVSPKKEVKQKGHRLFEVGLKPVAFLLIALLIASSAVAVYEYREITGLHNENAFLKGLNPEAIAYYNQFGLIPNTDVNASYSPPISMYKALIIGLTADNWTKASLQGFTINIDLNPWNTPDNTTQTNVNMYGVPLNPPTNYSGYVWEIGIQKTGHITIPPYDFILIDASTGQILPNPPLY